MKMMWETINGAVESVTQKVGQMLGRDSSASELLHSIYTEVGWRDRTCEISEELSKLRFFGKLEKFGRLEDAVGRASRPT